MIVIFLSCTKLTTHRLFKYSVLVWGLLLLISCNPADKKEITITQKTEPDLTFTCVYEKNTLPPADPAADIWFKQARELEKVDKYKRDYAKIGELYRKAAERNHPKAMLNLSNLISYGKVPPLPGIGSAQEVWDIIQKMAKLNISYGYYQMGHYLDTGYGVNADRTKALAYFRQAADLGNPEAQYMVGDIFISKRISDKQNPVYHPEIGKKILDCATQQGNGEAAFRLASYFRNVDKNYGDALSYFQYSARNGYLNGAIYLSDIFSTEKTSKFNYLVVTPDEKRSKRYEVIRTEIRNNPNARFPDIDKIVPLPPAELPEWDGSFEYKKQAEGQ